MEPEVPGLEERMARIEGILEQMNERFNQLEGTIQALDNRLDSSLRELRVQISTQFRWTVGLIIVTWITVLAAVLFK